MAWYGTMKQAFDMADEEISMFHRLYGFPRDLTHHTDREAPRIRSHSGQYEDHGNRSGSIVMWALLFEPEWGLHGRPRPQPVRV